MDENVGKGIVSIEADAKGLGKDIEKQVDAQSGHATSSGKSFGDKWGGALKLAAGSAIAAAVIAFAKSTVNAASDLNESANAVKVTFGGAADGITKLGEKAATAVGLSTNEFNSLAVRFSSFAMTVAGSGGDVVGTMDDMTKRAADFASVMNLDVKDAANIFQSGLAGESEPLRQYGIDLSAAAVSAFALSHGIADNAATMTEAQKVQARYGLLMEQTAKTAGDFANTSDGLANRQRIMAAQFENVKAKIGTALLPILAVAVGFITNQVIPAFIKIRDVVSAAFQWIDDNKAIVIAAFTGVAIAVGIVLVPAFIAWATTAGAAAVATIAAAAPIIALGVAAAALAAGIVWLYQNCAIFRDIVNAVRDFIVDKLVPAFMAIWHFISDNIIPIISTLVEVYIKALILEFNAVKFVITEIVIPALQVIWAFIRDKVIPIFEAIISTIITVATAVGEKISAIVGFITGIPGRIGNVLSSLWDDLKIGIESARQWVSDKIDAVVDFATKLPGRMAGIFVGMWDGIKDAFRAAINFIIRGWNSLHFKLPEFDTHIPGVGKIGGFDIGVPHINELANGGVITRPTLALLGETRVTEIASPEPLMRQIVREESGGGMPAIVVNNNRRDIGVGDLNHILAMARLAA